MALAPFVESIFGELTGVIQHMFMLPQFWLLLAWCVVICLMVDHAFK